MKRLMKAFLPIIFLICVHTDSKRIEKNIFYKTSERIFGFEFLRIAYLPQIFILFLFRSSITSGLGGEVDMLYIPVAVFMETPCHAYSYATYKYVKLCRRNVIASKCLRKEVKNKALSLPKTFCAK